MEGDGSPVKVTPKTDAKIMRPKMLLKLKSVNGANNSMSGVSFSYAHSESCIMRPPPLTRGKMSLLRNLEITFFLEKSGACVLSHSGNRAGIGIFSTLFQLFVFSFS